MAVGSRDVGVAVSIHAPARGATLRCTAPSRSRFQSTLPHGERPMARARLYPKPVSIHAPARGATVGSSITDVRCRFQSTLPHGERLEPQRDCAQVVFQSTLPHGERPPSCHAHKRCKAVSIHAPARGATVCPCCGTPSRRSFNPRSRTGSDKPTAAARSRWPFQSTLPHGERPTALFDPMQPVLFQSTLPHGERPYRV